MATRKNIPSRKRERQLKALQKLEAIENPNHRDQMTIRDLRAKLFSKVQPKVFGGAYTIEDYMDDVEEFEK